MNKVETYQLCHPELLSAGTLCELLKNSCIALPMLENLSKGELIEIFKRIAMPLPQRKYNLSRNLGKKLNDLRAKRNIEIGGCNGNEELLPTSDRLATDFDTGVKNRLKLPIGEAQQATKKIRLSNSCCQDNASEKDTKRKNEISLLSESKKRQKITWP